MSPKSLLIVIAPELREDTRKRRIPKGVITGLIRAAKNRSSGPRLELGGCDGYIVAAYFYQESFVALP
jgi:hypothetical protein